MLYSKEDWDEHLPAALYAYRISKQASSKFTPFFLMYNRNPRKAVTFEMQQEDDVEDEDQMSEEEEIWTPTASFTDSWRFESIAMPRQRKTLPVHRKGRKSSMMLNMMP